MRRLLRYTAIMLMVIMSAGSVWALSNSFHVTDAPNNKGDVLIFPWYLALDGGWQTKITVINTDTTNAVVAKVVVRSFKNSEELIDFFIYLSPADVWTGVMKKVGTNVVIFSDDDSAVSATGAPPVFANTTPINQPMFPLDCANDGDFLGYIEVIMGAYKSGQVVGTSKLAIYNGFLQTSLGNGTPAASGTGNTLSIGGMCFPAYGDANNQNPLSLAGYMELQNATLNLSTSLRATALKDYRVNSLLTLADETRLGENAMNSLGEVEAALAKNKVAMPYVGAAAPNSALHFLTFPTKLTARPNAPTNCDGLNPKSPFYKQNSADITSSLTTKNQWCINYDLKVYDLTEKTTTSGPFSGAGGGNSVCNEVNYIGTQAFPFAEGWASYEFKNSAATSEPFTFAPIPAGTFIGYNGAPVIPTYIYLGSLGISANYGAWTDSPVGGFNVAPPTPAGPNYNLVDYQYTDSAVDFKSRNA